MNPEIRPSTDTATVGYTATQIAAALGFSKPRVLKRLNGVPATGAAIVRGNEAQTWAIDSLPEELRLRIERNARAAGKPILDFVSDAMKPWEPKIPLSEVAESYLQEARKLREVLQPMFELIAAPACTPETLWGRGLQEYQRVFGHNVSERHLRRLMDKVETRDGGRGDFGRLELYVHEHPARKVIVPQPQKPKVSKFGAIEAIIAKANTANPSSGDRAAIWLHCFRHIEKHARDRRDLLSFLWDRAPFLAKSPNALRVNLDRKFEDWKKNDGKAGTLADGREEKRGIPTAEPYKREDVQRVKFRAVELGGRKAQAFRECVEEGLITDERLLQSYRTTTEKSYVPAALLAELRNVDALRDIHQGGRAAQKQKPSLDGEYSGIYSMDAISMDDFTFDVKFRVSDGNDWWRLIKGQCLLAPDMRSDRILQHALAPREVYTTGEYWGLLLRLTLEHGKAKRVIREGGIVRRGNLINNMAMYKRISRAREAFSEAEREFLFEKMGIVFEEIDGREEKTGFINSNIPRSKPVEGTGGRLQNLMMREPGYTGHDERFDCPEEVKHWERELGRRNPDAVKYFYSFEEWNHRLSEIIDQYNGIRHGKGTKLIPGLSPDEAFQKYWPFHDAPVKPDPSCLCLFASVVFEGLAVTKDGIALPSIPGGPFRYCDAQTGARVGKKVIAFFNPEFPEICTFTNEAQKDAFTVERLNPVNRLRTDERYLKEVSKVQAHYGALKTEYKTYKAKFHQTFRKNTVEKTIIEISAQMAAGQARQAKIQAKTKESTRRADRLSIPSALLSSATDEDRGMDLIEQARREHEQNLGKEDK
jgi:hypothetical protein